MVMLSKIRRNAGGLICALFVLGLLGASPAQAAVKKLKMSCIFPPSSYAYQVMKDKFTADVKERTNGEIEIEVYPPGALAKPMEQFDLVKRGAIDLGFSAGLMHARKIPEGVFEFSQPMSFFGKIGTAEAADQFYEFFYSWRDGYVYKKLSEVYAKHGIEYIGGGAGGGYGFLLNFPVNSLEDFKGKKIRSFGTLSVIVKELGASPATISTSEQYLALQRGTVDGTIYTYYSLEAYKLREVVTHIVYPPVITTPNIAIYANKKMFDGLTETQQKVIKDAFMENIKFYTGEAIKLENEYIELAKQNGIKEVTLSPADTKKLRDIAHATWPLATKRSEVAKELTELLKEFLAEKSK